MLLVSVGAAAKRPEDVAALRRESAKLAGDEENQVPGGGALPGKPKLDATCWASRPGCSFSPRRTVIQPEVRIPAPLSTR